MLQKRIWGLNGKQVQIKFKIINYVFTPFLMQTLFFITNYEFYISQLCKTQNVEQPSNNLTRGTAAANKSHSPLAKPIILKI